VSEPAVSRMRIVFGVGEPVKYVSHLDLLRAWERILRRAGVPLAYSQGFNPHPRMVIAMPLPVGCTGGREVVDVYLDEPLGSQDLMAMLEPVVPVGISAVSAEAVPLDGAALPSRIIHAVYDVKLTGIPQSEVERRVGDLLRHEALMVEFRRKRFDLRPLVGALAVRGTQDVMMVEATLLRDAVGRIGRPDVLLAALELQDYAQEVHRVRIAFDLSDQI
jgi:radical SAM-linked protein